MKAKVLIIGASGRVGSYVVKELEKTILILNFAFQQVIKKQQKNSTLKDVML